MQTLLGTLSLSTEGVHYNILECNLIHVVIIETVPFIFLDIRSHVCIIVPYTVFSHMNNDRLQFVNSSRIAILGIDTDRCQIQRLWKGESVVEFGCGIGVPIVFEAFQMKLQNRRQTLCQK